MSSKVILVMGLSGSGKTELATKLRDKLKADYHNADIMRDYYDDWDFSEEGRIRQAERLAYYASISDKKYVILDFICPFRKSREIVDADYTIWMNTTKFSKYKDTDGIFQEPNLEAELIIRNLNYDVDIIVKGIKDY